MKEFEYYGLFITDESKNTLIKWLNDNGYYALNGKLYLDHCTLLHKSKDDINIRNFCECCEGATFIMKVIGIGRSDKAMAFKVELPGVPCSNRIPHITILTFGLGKPYDSNNIRDWVKIPGIDISGVLKSVSFISHPG